MGYIPGIGGSDYYDRGSIEICDASKKAYCAAIYLVCDTTRGIYPRLLCSKGRIAPLKSLSIPRLELVAARILVDLLDSAEIPLAEILRLMKPSIRQIV